MDYVEAASNMDPFEYATIENENRNPTHQHIDDWREVPDTNWLCNRYSISGTTYICYTVWCPNPNNNYSTITYNGGSQQLGSLTTRHVTPDIEALPAYSQERMVAVRAFFEALKGMAKICIRSAFPEDFAPQG